MPKINIEKVISFSSEDSAYPASNILNSDPSKKWKTQKPGEKSANVVLQLKEATQINSIDIGNEHSAYVEVLVSRSGSDDDYKVLLVMSSFMTPIEARQSSNTTKVRMFTYNELSSPERDEKWDRIKIVCTQPFNCHVQYGLSFISFTSNDSKLNVVKPSTTKLVARSESPINLKAGSLFARRNELEGKRTLSSAIREASVQAQNDADKMRNREELLYKDDEIKENVKIDALIAKRDQEKRERDAQEFIDNLAKEAKANKLKCEEEKKKKKIADEEGTSSMNNSINNNNKRKLDLKQEKMLTKKKIKKPTLPFHELLKGVIFTISGIQNPERANLRTVALSMGAKYKPDWDNSCTHLICAFANTPKFNQVRGKGKIVKIDWILDCNVQRKRLPWRRYALDRRDQNKPESEEEIDERNDDDIDSKSESDAEPELENVQKKFKRNGIIVDSPCGTPSPVLVTENEWIYKDSSTTPSPVLISDSDLVQSNDNENKEDLNLNTSIIDETNIYDCDTDVDEDFCLKATSIK